MLPVGGSSRIPRIRRWLQEHCGTIPLRDERPVEAVVLGALALTPGVQIRDVLAQGVSLRCWDRRSSRHRWHPLFVPGQSWPTSEPLELVLACSRDGQSCLELVLGEPLPQQRSEVIFRDGLPVLRPRPAGAPTVRPGPSNPAPCRSIPPASGARIGCSCACGSMPQVSCRSRGRISSARPPWNRAASAWCAEKVPAQVDDIGAAPSRTSGRSSSP